MALFALSDPHLSLSGDKPMDVFGGTWFNFEKRLQEYWTDRVGEDDTVVIPGDISWGMTLEEAKEDFLFLHHLPGRKILMKGNHDYWWSSLAKLAAFCEENGFEDFTFLQNDAALAQGKIVCGTRGWMCEDKMQEQDLKILRREAMRLDMSLKKAKALADEEEEKTGLRPETVAFFHYPVISAGLRENPLLERLMQSEVKRVYYGHLHNAGNLQLTEERDGLTFTLVSADYIHFTPLLID